MSKWKVFCDTIEIFPHPNADSLELGRVGSFQVVVGKNIYSSGDVVVFAPKRSILPEDLRKYFKNEATGASYLVGPNSDRVGSIRLRGEESEGTILPYEWWSKVYGNKKSPNTGEDISKELGIIEYIPGTAGTPNKKGWGSQGDIVQNVRDVVELDRFVRHDVEQYGIFKNEFILGEPVSVSEKIHGSQVNIIKDRYGKIAVTSKGRAEKNLVLREYPVSTPFRGKGIWNKVKNTFKWLTGWKGEMNEYWKVAHSSGIINFLNLQQFCGKEIQVIGEVIPFQKGYSYGYEEGKYVKVFRVVVDTIEQPYGFNSPILPILDWVPQLYSGPYDPEKILPLAEGKETVSGKSLHLREGVVLTPKVFRKSKNGTPLLVKILNSRYKNNDDDPV